MRTTTGETGAGKKYVGALALAAAGLSALTACANQPAGASVNSAVSAVNALAANLRAAADATPSPTPTPQPSPEVSAAGLIVPVAGVRPGDLQDTYTQSRSEGRVHNAIDIPAALGTPVLAAADGRVVKLFNSVPGGVTLYQLGTDGHAIYYYAHLQRYADGIAEGQILRRGDTLGYVGDTGNAGPGNYHLHFSVSNVTDPKRWWSGTNVNPYPLLTGK